MPPCTLVTRRLPVGSYSANIIRAAFGPVNSSSTAGDMLRFLSARTLSPTDSNLIGVSAKCGFLLGRCSKQYALPLRPVAAEMRLSSHLRLLHTTLSLFDIAEVLPMTVGA